MKPKGFSASVPPEYIRRAALTWESSEGYFVLADEILDWIEDNDIAYGIIYDGHHSEGDLIEYEIVFKSSADLFHFKLRWN